MRSPLQQALITYLHPVVEKTYSEIDINEIDLFRVKDNEDT